MFTKSRSIFGIVAGKTQNKYIPALRYDWLTALYDPLLQITMRERTFKHRLVEQANIQPHHRVLDLGCGTGTLTLLAKARQPEAEIIGIDGDAKVLSIAKDKAVKAEVAITFDQGLSYELPYPDESFDRVLTSLLFHHLTRENKECTLREIHRVLRPDGELHIADWGKPQNTVMRYAFYMVQLLDGFETTTDNMQGLLPRFMAEAGLKQMRETTRLSTMFGTLSLYSARRGCTPK